MFLNIVLDKDIILSTLKEILLHKEVKYLNIHKQEEKVNSDTSDEKCVYFYHSVYKSSTYPLEIIILGFSEEEFRRVQPMIAYRFSEFFKTQVLIDFMHPDEPTNPFYSLLFYQSMCFLVDDSNWETSNTVRVIKPWPFNL